MEIHSSIGFLKYIHGAYNALVIPLFIYQGLTGIMIRKERMTERPPLFPLIKRHRTFGPIFVLMGMLGFFGGVLVVYIHERHFLEHPLHFIMGFTIICLLIIVFMVSRMIKGSETPWRTPHFIVGIMLICLYLVQGILGIMILFFE